MVKEKKENTNVDKKVLIEKYTTSKSEIYDDSNTNNDSEVTLIEYKNKIKHVAKILRKNVPWLVTFFTSIFVVVLAVLNFIDYINLEMYFNFFDLNFSIVMGNSFIYEISKSFLFFLSFCGCSYAFWVFNHLRKIKNKDMSSYDKEVRMFLKIVNWAFLIFMNIYVLYYADIRLFFSNLNLVSSLVFAFCLIIMLLIEWGFSIFFHILLKSIKSKILEKIILIIAMIQILLIGFVALIFDFLFTSYMNIKQNKEYYMIDEKTVIVYTTKDYYLALDCQIEKNVDGNEIITIYRNTQNKISSDNVRTKYRTFKNVKIMDENDEKNKDSLDDKTS